jgi:signal transduction histidine kinase
MKRAYAKHAAILRNFQGPQGIDMLQHLPAGVVQIDLDYRLVLANATARRYVEDLEKATVGDRVLSLGGTPIETLLTPRPDDLPNEIVQAGLPSRIFTIRAHALPATNAAGWVLLIQDVTAERHLQDQRAQQDRLTAMERLVAGVANEFNTLFFSIVGYAELLQTQVPRSQAAQEDLEAIVKWSHRGVKKVHHLLDLSGQSPSR